MFDSFRQSLEDLINRATPPEERRAIVSQMRDTLVQAKMGVADLREALERARQQLVREQREVETMRRRQELATGVRDSETATLAERHGQLHAERAAVLARKVAAQEEELVIAERDLAEMTAELKRVAGGTDVPPRGVAPGAESPEGDATGTTASETLGSDIDALGRARARTEREAEADRRLDELKRRMGQ